MDNTEKKLNILTNGTGANTELLNTWVFAVLF